MTERRLRFLRLKWITTSALGAMIGAGLAASLFPELGFNQRRFDQFSEKHVLFALITGTLFALAQIGLLFYLIRKSTASRSQLFFGWASITSVGFAALLAPLWYSDPLWVGSFSNPLLLPLLPTFLMMGLVLILPGMLILAVGQCYLLQVTFSVGRGWIIPTMIGVALGALLVGPAFFTLGFKSEPVVDVFGDPIIDATLAAVIGASIGTLQAGELQKTID